MRRVVVTGLGIVSSIGNNAEEVVASLRAGKSGIESSPEMVEHGFRSQVAGTIKLDVSEHVDKRTLRFLGQPDHPPLQEKAGDHHQQPTADQDPDHGPRDTGHQREEHEDERDVCNCTDC